MGECSSVQVKLNFYSKCIIQRNPPLGGFTTSFKIVVVCLAMAVVKCLQNILNSNFSSCKTLLKCYFCSAVQCFSFLLFLSVDLASEHDNMATSRGSQSVVMVCCSLGSSSSSWRHNKVTKNIRCNEDLW